MNLFMVVPMVLWMRARGHRICRGPAVRRIERPKRIRWVDRHTRRTAPRFKWRTYLVDPFLVCTRLAGRSPLNWITCVSVTFTECDQRRNRVRRDWPWGDMNWRIVNRSTELKHEREARQEQAESAFLTSVSDLAFTDSNPSVSPTSTR